MPSKPPNRLTTPRQLCGGPMDGGTIQTPLKANPGSLINFDPDEDATPCVYMLEPDGKHHYVDGLDTQEDYQRIVAMSYDKSALQRSRESIEFHWVKAIDEGMADPVVVLSIDKVPEVGWFSSEVYLYPRSKVVEILTGNFDEIAGLVKGGAPIDRPLTVVTMHESYVAIFHLEDPR